MANTFNLGNGNWAQKTEKLLAYNAENNNYKPLPFDFDRASTATVVNKNGLIETVGVDEPRIDFLNNTKGHLLLEPSRQNVVTYSENLEDVSWEKINASITSNYGISPEGVQNSTRILCSNTTDARVVIAYGGALNNGVQYTWSGYYKGTAGEKVVINAISSGTGAVNASKVITFNGNWQREDVTFTVGTALEYVFINDARVGSDTTATDFEFFGAQLEEGSYATSYIPTSGSAVTRSAETCNNAGNSNVINSVEGVLYAEVSSNENTLNKGISLSDGSYDNRVLLYFDTSNNIRAYVFVGGVNQANIVTNGYDYSQNGKIAFRYKANDFKLYINGQSFGSDTSGTTFSSDTLTDVAFDINGAATEKFYGNCKEIKVYNTALSDSELIALTTI